MHIYFINFKIDNKFCGKSQKYQRLIDLLYNLVSLIDYNELYKHNDIQMTNYRYIQYKMFLADTDYEIEFVEYIKCLRSFIDENI